MTEQVNIGISERDRVFIAEALKNLLADSYLLYIQTHNFHWNVTGPNFNALHIMFEGQYKELADAVDDIAERIRALDVIAPATYKAFSALSAIEEVDGTISAEQMISTLVKSHETVINTCRKILKTGSTS